MAARRKNSRALVPSSLSRITRGLKAELEKLVALKARNRSESRALMMLASPYESRCLVQAFALAYKRANVRMGDARWPQLREILSRLPICAPGLAAHIDLDRDLYRRVERWCNKLDCRDTEGMTALATAGKTAAKDGAPKRRRLAKAESKKAKGDQPFTRCGRIDSRGAACNKFVLAGETCRAHDDQLGREERGK